MPKKTLPRIAEVRAGEEPWTLHVRWDRGDESSIDVSGMIESFRVYAPLRQSPELFRQIRVGEHGTDVVWTDEIDMSADTLWRLAQEQSGATMTAEAFRRWRERQGYTLDAAARALGLSRRMVAYYEEGNRPIPRVVALATKALSDPNPDSLPGTRVTRLKEPRNLRHVPERDVISAMHGNHQPQAEITIPCRKLATARARSKEAPIRAIKKYHYDNDQSLTLCFSFKGGRDHRTPRRRMLSPSRSTARGEILKRGAQGSKQEVSKRKFWDISERQHLSEHQNDVLRHEPSLGRQK